MKISLALDIERPPAEVFPWLSDPERAKRWMTSVSSTEIVHETPERVGTTFRERVEEDGRGTELTGVITAFEENRLIAFHLEGDYNDVDVSYRVAPTDGGTRLSMSADVRFKSTARLVMLVTGPLFKRKIVGQLESELATLKQLCERPVA
jgi:uncharacterized protein YndB with AHSA1/START domain